MQIIGTPGHYQPGSDTNHFLGRCDECDAHYLAGMTLTDADYRYRGGFISKDQFEAFKWVWQASAPRFTFQGSTEALTPAIQEHVDAITAARPHAEPWNEALFPGDGSI